MTDEDLISYHEGLACTELWIAAIRLYYSDCYYWLRGSKQTSDEALDDLTGSQALLGNLCAPLSVNPDAVAALMLEGLAAGSRWAFKESLIRTHRRGAIGVDA